jgi:hypothetical protein
MGLNWTSSVGDDTPLLVYPLPGPAEVLQSPQAVARTGKRVPQKRSRQGSSVQSRGSVKPRAVLGEFFFPLYFFRNHAVRTVVVCLSLELPTLLPSRSTTELYYFCLSGCSCKRRDP